VAFTVWVAPDLHRECQARGAGICADHHPRAGKGAALQHIEPDAATTEHHGD
jgi:hypothetical protein